MGSNHNRNTSTTSAKETEAAPNPAPGPTQVLGSTTDLAGASSPPTSTVAAEPPPAPPAAAPTSSRSTAQEGAPRPEGRFRDDDYRTPRRGAEEVIRELVSESFGFTARVHAASVSSVLPCPASATAAERARAAIDYVRTVDQALAATRG